ELELHEPLVLVAPPEHDDLRRSAGQVDRNVARYFELRIVHVLVAGTDDLVDALDVRKPADRLCTAERPHLVDAEKLRRGGDASGAFGRRADDDAPDARS